MHDVYVLNADGTSVPMERVSCVSEDIELQRILGKNYNLLPGDQISPDNPRRWLLIKREMPVPNPGAPADCWSLDFLFADQDATPTLVECKRFANTQSRREVIGQLIEYAANGQYYWDKKLLREYAEKTAVGDGSTLKEVLSALNPPEFDSVDTFFDCLENNLRNGKIRMVFFLEQSPMELRSAVDFLSRQMEQSEILLVEARQYRHKLNETVVVVPTLFGYTDEARKANRDAVVGPGQQWDEGRFFDDASARIGQQVEVLKALYQRLKSDGFTISWGKGKVHGTFNVRIPTFSSPSLITVNSEGWMSLNLGSLPERCAEMLRTLATALLGLEIPNGQTYPIYFVTKWSDKVDVLADGLKSIALELERPDNQAVTADTPEPVFAP